MRSRTKCLIGASLFVVAGSAAAQSSVTLYGVADSFIEYSGNGAKHSWSERSGGGNASMFGLEGKEDLGGGLKAIFDLENGYNINDGSGFVDPTAMFYRQAWVGLNHADYGRLTFGRQYQPTVLAIYPTDPFLGNELLSPATIVGAVDVNTLATQSIQERTSNSILYQSPVIGGLRLMAMYGLSATTTQPVPQNTGNMVDVGIAYSGYGLYAAVAYQNQHASTVTLPGLPGPLNQPGTEHFTAGLAYRIGIVNLQANYMYSRSKDAPAGSLAALLGAGHSFATMEFGATIQATAADTIEIACLYRNVRGAHDNTPGAEIGIDHLLSKRTSIYARAGYMKNNGTATTSWPGVVVSGPNATQTMVALGMTHRF